MRSQVPLVSNALPEARILEHMRMPPDHLRGDGIDDVGEGEASVLLGHARVIDDLQEEIAELVLQPVEIVPRDRVGDLVGLLDRVWRDAREVLLAVPRTAALRIAQPRHDPQEIARSCSDLALLSAIETGVR